MHRRRDGRLDAAFHGKLMDAHSCARTLDNHVCAGFILSERLSTGKRLAERTVTGVLGGAGRDEVTHARKPHGSERVSPKSG